MRFWKWVLWIGVGIFLLTRVLTLMSFPVFNDEAIYLQYAQLVHSDFSKYKFVSEGGLYADWKPPLQYWFGSLFMGMTSDPLLAGRMAVFIVSLFGLWGLYLFTKELFDKRAAAVAVVLYALCPPVLLYNNQFIAETFVFSIAPWMYWCFLRAIRPDKVRAWYALAAAAFGGLLLISKQSGAVYLILALLLPLAVMDQGNPEKTRRKWDWRAFFIRLGVVAAGMALAKLFSYVGVSSQSGQLESQFNSNWLMSASQVFGLPWQIWQANWQSIWSYYTHYYSVFIILPILYFFFITVRRRSVKNAAIGLGFLGGSLAILLLLKGFNEYIYNTAVIVFLVPLLVQAFFPAWEAARTARGVARGVGIIVLASFALMLANWTYQDVLMKVSPADYIRRGTPWMVENYLENWSGGFGVAQAIALVKQQPGPGLVLADPQWGNPRTSLEVWNAEYPDLEVIGLTNDFETASGTVAAKAYILSQSLKTNMVVFSAATNSTRVVWQDNVEKYLCDKETQVQVDRDQPPIIICSF